ncbi:hypothetical protein [Desulfobulbus sp.]|uniref:hypothetical protein n=1 Tax=Desulfobulbus sp. TaxID=895 RepID=UPI00286F8E62|nr:hypothetical protein [Desulfobulbus sp.]
MLPLTPAFMGSFLAAALCLSLLLVLARRQRIIRQRQAERILALQRKIDAALEDESGVFSPRQSFGTSLKEASLTTSLQRPRLDTMAKVDRQTPEKYRILAKLAAQGMDSAQIAAVLGISSVEAAQLLSLCHMAEIGR